MALHRYAPVVAPRLRETGWTPMQRSALPYQILQQLDDVIGEWEENPDFSMGPEGRRS